jgi:hypothetical protein
MRWVAVVDACLPAGYAAEEDDDEPVLDAPVVVVELVGAGAAGVGVGAAAGLVPAVSDEAGVFVLSVPQGVGCSGDSFSDPGFILSE